MKKLNLLWIALIISTMLFGAPPTAYYSGADAKSDNTLRLALQTIIEGHTNIGYDGLKYLYEYSDTEDAAGVTIIDIYSTCGYAYTTSLCAGGCGGGFNREHSVPQSWFGKASPMVSDAFHIYPTNCDVNGQRSNYPYGEVTSGKTLPNGLGRLGTSSFPGYSGTVFEPDNEYKGDLARTYFYMATRYANLCSSWSGGMFGSDLNGLKTYTVNLMMKWHRQDPVSPKEILRNEVIYGNPAYNKGSKKQNNRNPFIDHPELAEYIWGNNKGQAWYGSSTAIESVTFANLQIYPNPAQDFVTITGEGLDNLDYKIFDISGQLVASGVAMSGELVPISHLSGGAYLLQINADGKTQVVKLMITK